MTQIFGTTDWLFWGIALMIGYPLLIVGLTELSHRLPGTKYADYQKPLDLFRNSCLFVLFVTVLFRGVLEWDNSWLAVRIVDTAFWITFLNAALAVFNAIFFGNSAIGTWRAAMPRLLIDLSRLLIVLIGSAIVVSQIWGVDLRGLIAALGVGSLVIGLALQDTLANVFSGIALISAKQFKVGDWIRVGDTEGQVKSLNWRTISIETITGDLVILPNSMIAKDRLRNLGLAQNRHVMMQDVKLSFEYPPEQMIAALIEASNTTAEVLAEPKPVVRIFAYEDHAIVYRVILWTAEFRGVNRVRSELLSNIWYLFERRGIQIPARFNTRFDIPAEHRRAVPKTPEELAVRLAQSGIFQHSAKDLQGLAAGARVQVFRKGELLMSAGKSQRDVLLVSSGSAEAISPSASPAPVRLEFTKGQLILFKPMFRSGESPLTIRATSDVEVIAIPLPDFERFLVRDASFATNIERILNASEVSLAKLSPASVPGATNGHLDDRAQILKDMFRA